MKRLTKRKFDGTGVSIEGATWEAFEKLAQYEDAEESGRWVALPPKTHDVDFMRIFDLITADGEGRAIILPCKLWDTLYDAYTGDIRHHYVTEFSTRGEDIAIQVNDFYAVGGCYCHASDIGKTVFLTSAGAEAALKGAKTGDIN